MLARGLEDVTSISAYVLTTTLFPMELLLMLFSSILSQTSPRKNQLPDCAGIRNTSELLFNCTEKEVVDILRSCPNWASSPDGISYRLIIAVGYCIVKPLCILLQQSLNAGVFPRAWKQAVVLPLYREQGSCDHTSSFRPVILLLILASCSRRSFPLSLSASWALTSTFTERNMVFERVGQQLQTC